MKKQYKFKPNPNAGHGYDVMSRSQYDQAYFDTKRGRRKKGVKVGDWSDWTYVCYPTGFRGLGRTLLKLVTVDYESNIMTTPEDVALEMRRLHTEQIKMYDVIEAIVARSG